MAYDIDEIVASLRVSPQREAFQEVADEVDRLFQEVQNSFNKVWSSVSREYDKFLEGTYKDVTASWEQATQDIKSVTGNALKDSVVAVFEGDMDQVEVVWESAWQRMIGKVDGLLNGLFDKVLKRAYGGMESLLAAEKIGPGIATRADDYACLLAA